MILNSTYLFAIVAFSFLCGCSGTAPIKSREAIQGLSRENYHSSPSGAIKGQAISFVVSEKAQTLRLSKESPFTTLSDQKRAAFGIVQVPPSAAYLYLESEAEFYDRLNQTMVIPKVFTLRGGDLVALEPQTRHHSSTFNSCISNQVQFDLKHANSDNGRFLIAAYVRNDEDMIGPISKDNPFFAGTEMRIRLACDVNADVRVHSTYFGNILVRTSNKPVLK